MLLSGCGFAGFGGTSSTKNREKLDQSLVNITADWYYDEAGLLDNDRDLLRGMEVFYDKTGIQPYLYISEVTANGLSDAEAERISNEIYEQLFNDEGHLLICYFPNENEGQDDLPYMIKGRDTNSIMDEEAEDIFWDHFWKNYDNLDYTYDEFLGETFKDAGNSIMAKPIPWSTVAIVVVAVAGVIVVVIIIKKIVKANIAQKNKEQEDLERMLDKPLETFGDDTVEELKNKYDDN